MLHIMTFEEIEVDHLVSNAGILSVRRVEEYVDITKARSVVVITFKFSLLSCS